MADLRSALETLFSSNVVVHNVGGDDVKVVDTSSIQTISRSHMNNRRGGRGGPKNGGSQMGGSGFGGLYGAGEGGGEQSRYHLYHDYELMDRDAIVSAALDFYADESVVENEHGEMLTINTDHGEVERILHNLYYDVLNVEFNLRSWIRDMVKYGDCFIHLNIDYESSEQLGVYNVQSLSPYHVDRVEGQDPANPYDVWFEYDGPEAKEEELGYWEVGHFSLRDSQYAPYGKCLAPKTKVSTLHGEKDICNINVGDEVWTYNTSIGKFETSIVQNKKCSGKKNILKINTQHNFVRCSDNHPILTINSDGDSEYKEAENVEEGDLVVQTNEFDTQDFQNPKMDKTLGGFNKNGWKNSLKNIPDHVNEEWAEFFGFMIGDGWINESANQVSFANGEHLHLNEKYTELLEKFSGKNPRSVNTSGRENAQTTVGSKMLVNVLKNNGFISGAHKKRIPDWVYKSSQSIKESFMRGFIDADGSMTTDQWDVNRYQIELCNKDLIKDTKRLLQTMRVKTGNVLHRNRSASINGYNYEDVDAYYLYFYLDGEKTNQMKKYDVVDNDDIIISPVRSVETDGVEKVWDIQVSKNSNFVANGIVVHNSVLENARKTWKRLTMMEDAMLIHRIMRAPERRIFKIDVGNLEPKAVESFMNRTMQELKKQPLVDPDTGEYDLQFNLMNMMDDYYMPVRGRDDGTEISTLNSLSWNGIEDIEYLRQKLMSALRVPNAFLGYERDIEGKATLAQESIKFANQVQHIQKIIANELTKIGIIHLFSQGIRDERLVDFELGLTHPSHFVEQQKVDLLDSKFNLARTIEDQNMHSTEWIMKNIFNMSDDDIERERKLKMDDWKREFVKEQLTREGNNPIKTGQSFGTPGDLADSGASELKTFDFEGEDNEGVPSETEDSGGYSLSPDNPFKDKDTEPSDSDFKTTQGDVSQNYQGGSPLAAAEERLNRHRELITETFEGEMEDDEQTKEELEDTLKDIDWMNEDAILEEDI